MASSIIVRNLTSTAISILRVEQFEDPGTLQSKAGGYLFGSKSTTSAAPTSPELSGHAQSFNHQDLEVTLQPFESYTLSKSKSELQGSTATLSSPTLRITVETSGHERHRIDTHPSYTQKSSQYFTPLSANPSTTYKALFHPSRPTPHLTLHTSHILSYTSWMSTLPDTLPLSALSIPGTHNSHTHYRALPSVRCQVHDVRKQLDNGIRFLDIRVQPTHATEASKKDLYLVHGAFPVSLTGPKYLEPVLKMCYEFLQKNPRETVLVSIKREGVGSATDEHLARILEEHYIAPNADRWHTGTTIPYLGDARGKLVLVRRYNTAKTLDGRQGGRRSGGLDATGWPHNATHALFPQPASTFCLQDFCEVLEADVIPTKIQHCNDHLVRSAAIHHPIPGVSTDERNPVPPEPLHLNFLSASNFWKRACWPEAIAKIVNRSMEEWICAGHHLQEPEVTTKHPNETSTSNGQEREVVRRAKTGDGGTGVIVMDCVGENGDWELVRLIVGMNMGVLSKFGANSGF